eukprot:TRINITY_DN21739_c0_g1_i1.p1 TRINITY_DN21739_c0_g1~~TRINITY_DN21739_c0_g1_i1.p1  ORF type:complete len:485 (+),score=166.78 TRINITY_DN21739_c0_g1_i1:111-1565(+)
MHGGPPPAGRFGAHFMRVLLGVLAAAGLLLPWALAAGLVHHRPPPTPYPAAVAADVVRQLARDSLPRYLRRRPTPQPTRPRTDPADLRRAEALQRQGRSAAEESPTFRRWLRSQPWGDIRGTADASPARHRLLGGLWWWLSRPPPAVGERCATPPPRPPTNAECEAAAHFSRRRASPRVLVDVAVFGFDLDALEVRWREVGGVVDHVAVIESTLSHQGSWKPALFRAAAASGRFSFLRPEVTSVVLPAEAVLAEAVAKAGQFAVVAAQERLGLERLRGELPEQLRRLWDSDGEMLLVWGDADEVPSADALTLAKWCEVDPAASLPLDVASWVPMPGFDLAYRTDWPVHADLPHTFGNPRISLPRDAGRGYGSAGRWLLGGMHLTVYPLLPLVLQKVMQNAHGDGDPRSHAGLWAEVGGAEGAISNGTLLLGTAEEVSLRTASAQQLLEQDRRYRGVLSVGMRRLMVCLRERFPAWWGRADGRAK